LAAKTFSEETKIMGWKLKLGEDKKPIVNDDGKIMYIDPEGKEIGLDPVGMYTKIIDLGKENQKHRLKAKEYKDKLGLFEDIDDLETWKKDAETAIKTVKNFNDKEYLKADKVDKLKADITSAYEEKIKQLGDIYANNEADLKKQIDTKADQIRRLLISKHFAMSNYFSGGDKSKTILPANIAEDHFGRHFKIDEGPDGLPVVRAFYASGEPVLSRQNPGDPANFDEAIGLIIDKYPGKESILRSNTSGGSGASSGTGDNTGTNQIEQLRKDWAEALQKGNTQQAIVLKNRLYVLEQKEKQSA